MTIEGFALAGTFVFSVGCLTFAALDWIRTNRRHREWVNGPRQAPSEPMPTRYEQEWLQAGWDRDDCPNVVEDWELHEDAEVAELEECYGQSYFLNTPEILRRLAGLR